MKTARSWSALLLALLLCAASAPLAMGEGEQAHTLAAVLMDREGESVYVQFGSYAYESNGTPRPVVWRVLSGGGQTALLLSEQILLTHYYQEEESENPEEELQWLNSDLCAYLNGTFVREAFTGEQRSVINETPSGRVFLLTAADLSNPDYGFDPLLDEEDPARRATGTPYALSGGVDVREGHSPYWTSTQSKESMQFIRSSGAWGTAREERTNVGVRPAISLWSYRVEVAGGTGSLEDPYVFSFPDGEAPEDAVETTEEEAA